MSSAKLAKVDQAVGKMVSDKKAAGAITMVARKGKIVHFSTYGMRDIDSKKPVEKDTIMRFCQMLINKGQLQDRRILKTQTVEMMIANQLPKGVYLGKGVGFGLGGRVQIKARGSQGHVGEYGWGGAASTHFWISPKDDLVVIALSQYKPFSSRLQRLVKPLVYDAIEKN